MVLYVYTTIATCSSDIGSRSVGCKNLLFPTLIMILWPTLFCYASIKGIYNRVVIHIPYLREKGPMGNAP